MSLKLRLRQLDIRVTSGEGLYGVRIRFDKGLVILRADNSSGKSLCIQSIIYALGLEGMLSPSHQVPLQYAVTDKLYEDHREVPVLESNVLLEIENQQGNILTLQRPIKSKDQQTNLVTVWEGPLLSERRENLPRRDYFVRMEGAAQRPMGFHTRLTDFLGWSLPTVRRFDGSEAPLYLECIFPLMIIEQKHGWAGIQARMPVHYRIREMGKRATEFLMNLDAYAIAVKRQALSEQADAIKTQWHTLRAKCESAVLRAGGVLNQWPSQPAVTWPPIEMPGASIIVDNLWTPLGEAIKKSSGKLKHLESEEIPRVEQASKKLTSELQETERTLQDTELIGRHLFQEFELERSHVEAIEKRLVALREDLQRYKDVQRLRKIGSENVLDISEGTCPTCRQPVPDSLLPQVSSQSPMALDENVGFIENQVKTFDAMREDAQRVLVGKEQRLRAVRTRTDELRERIRALKKTLVLDGRLPSLASLEERINLSSRLRDLKALQEEFRGYLGELEAVSAQWREVLAKIEALRDRDLSDADEVKLQKLERFTVDQLSQYKFRSLEAESVKISPENYRPIHEGFDLGFNISASDMIRLIWAYLYGLLELGRGEDTNHLGLLVLDEPRQQQTDRVSFAEFARRAAQADPSQQQVIIATSEEESLLKEMLDKAPHQYLPFTGKLLTRLGS